jgi:hypothetical protein
MSAPFHLKSIFIDNFQKDEGALVRRDPSAGKNHVGHPLVGHLIR